MESNDNDKDENVVELGKHEATVASVITRLHRSMEKIKSITCVVEWDNENVDVVHDSRSVSSLIFDAKLLDLYASDILGGALNGTGD